jgi:hypothetical protein
MPVFFAHGQYPGTTLRPYTGGILTGAAASVPALGVLWGSGALNAVSERYGLPGWACALLVCSFFTVAGLAYGAVLKRLANTPHTAWIYGSAFGYLLWLIGPSTLQVFLTENPLRGVPAQGVFAAHLVYGLLLGVLFRPIHQGIMPDLEHVLSKTPGWQNGGTHVRNDSAQA